MADRLYKQPDNIVFTWVCGNPKGEGAEVILRHKTRVWEDIKEFLMKAVGLPSTREKTLPAADEVAPPFPDATLVTRPKDAPSIVVFKFLEPATTAFYKMILKQFHHSGNRVPSVTVTKYSSGTAGNVLFVASRLKILSMFTFLNFTLTWRTQTRHTS